MHLSHDTAAHPPSHALSLQHSATRPSGTALQKVENISCELQPLRLEYQAARQVGPALACRQVSQFIEADHAELCPGLRKTLVILGHGRVTQQLVAAERSGCPQPFRDTITHVLLGHVEGERLPSDEEQTALCSFLHTLDEGHRTALQRPEHDPVMNLAQQQDDHGFSLLYLAVSKGMTCLVGWLLNTQPSSFSATAPFTGANDAKINPLHWAVAHCNQSMVRLLLGKSVDINCRDMRGRTPLFRIVEKRANSIYRQRGAGVDRQRSANSIARQRSANSIARLLLDKGADVNIRDRFGTHVMHLLVLKEGRDMLSVLLDGGADINSVDLYGRTPLHGAVLYGDVVMASFLVERGSDINRSDRITGTPLHMAIGKNNPGMACFLLQNGADINYRNADGKSPLHWAVERGLHNIVRILLEHNADVSRRTHRGVTALHAAVESRNERVISLLLQKKADVNAQDDSGVSPLALAIKNGNDRVVHLLRGQEGGSIS